MNLNYLDEDEEVILRRAARLMFGNDIAHDLILPLMLELADAAEGGGHKKWLAAFRALGNTTVTAARLAVDKTKR